MIERQAAPLREQAVNEMRSAIVDGVFEPGQRLKEKDLCERFGVSRTVVREVLRQLEGETLILVEPQVGPVVRILSTQDVRDLYEVRASLESTTGRLAARNATPTQISELEHLYARIVNSHEMDMHDLIALKDEFYAKLVEISGNRVIGQMLDNVQARISQLRRRTLSSPHRHAEMVRELGDVVNCIRIRDEEGAYKSCDVHVRSAGQIALHGDFLSNAVSSGLN